MPDIDTRIGLIAALRRYTGMTLAEAIAHVDLVGEDVARELVRKQEADHA